MRKLSVSIKIGKGSNNQGTQKKPSRIKNQLTPSSKETKLKTNRKPAGFPCLKETKSPGQWKH